MDCSDEFQGSCATHFKCQDTQVALSTGVVTDHLDTCVPNKVRCDGNGDCKDASDECSCPQSVFCPAPGEQTVIICAYGLLGGEVPAHDFSYVATVQVIGRPNNRDFIN